MPPSMIHRLPQGCRTVGGTRAGAMERCRQVFMSRFASFGYRPFLPSGLQLIQSAWERLPSDLKGRTVCLTSPFGEPCCLRADLTLAAVAYLGAHYAPQERPLRLCYAERVYRSSPPPETELEGTQIGAELLGWEGEGADWELLFLLIGLLEALAVPDVTVVLGDVTLFARALQGLPTETARRLTRALQEGNLSDYGAALRSLADPLGETLTELPRLKGGDEVLRRGAELFGFESVATLTAIKKNLDALGLGGRIRFDLSLVRELDYYSGPLFDVYGGTSGRALGGGGRYDTLLAEFGILGQALGFGLDLERLCQASVFPNGSRGPAMAWTGGLSAARAIARAAELCDEGLEIELSWQPSKATSIKLAEGRGFSFWIDLARENVVEIATGKTFPLDLWIREGI